MDIFRRRVDICFSAHLRKTDNRLELTWRSGDSVFTTAFIVYYIYVCIYIHTYKHIHTHTHTHTYIYIYTCRCVYI